MNAAQWDSIVADLKTQAQSRHEARELGLKLCRQIIQHSARSIRHIHRLQYAEAEALLAQAKAASTEAREALTPYGELFYAGYLHDAEKEYVEAACVAAIVADRDLPTPDELGVLIMSYLNGVGEAASEVRRFALDAMRRREFDLAERILGVMETIYDDLITFDYADSMTSGLRRTCDALRPVIERTRSDLTTALGQHALVEELRRSRGEGDIRFPL